MLGSQSARRARRARRVLTAGVAAAVAGGTVVVALATSASATSWPAEARPAVARPATASAAAAQAGRPPAAPSTVRTPLAGSQVSCTSPRPALASRLSHDIAGALRGRPGTAAVAFYDRTTATTCAYHLDTAFDSASVVKVTVLGALLRTAMDQHRALTAHEVALTTAMITKSDNDATNALWQEVGHRGIQRFLDLAGMRETVPDPGGYWGHTQITAADQVKLLRLLTSDTGVLDRNARGYALGLMSRVDPGQRWGVSAGAPGSATVQLKNGWLPRDTGGWRVHSVGAFTGRGHDYGIAVLSQGNGTMNDGITTIEAAARAIHHDLGV